MSKQRPHVRFLAVASRKGKRQHLVEELSVILASGGRCLIWASDEKQAVHVDRFLWEFEPTSFIPHALWPCSIAVHPVIISWQPLVLPNVSHLIVLHPHPSEPSDSFTWMMEYQHVLEFADLSDSHLQHESRKRFKTWLQYQVKPSYEKPVEVEEPEEETKAVPAPPKASATPAPKRQQPQPSGPSSHEPMDENVYDPSEFEQPMEEPPAFLMEEPPYPYG